MRIDDIVNIADAELVNSGYINEVLAFATQLEKVKREFLFISNDIKIIREAIKEGAYAILFSDDLEIIDEEIAWIKVQDINESLLKLLKYKLLNQVLYVTDDLTLQIIKSINKDKKLAIIDKMEVEYLNDDYIFLTSLDRIKNIALNKKELNERDEIKLTESSIFISNFIYKSKSYSLIFPSVYQFELEKSLNFFNELDLDYSLKQITIDRFVPQFVNSRFEKVDFGKTEKVIIQGIKKDNYFIRELNFIFEKVKYSNVKFFDKNNIKKIYQEEFNFAILIDSEIEFKEKNIKEVSLF